MNVEVVEIEIATMIFSTFLKLRRGLLDEMYSAKDMNKQLLQVLLCDTTSSFD